MNVDATTIIVLLVAVLLAAGLGWLAATFRAHKTTARLESEKTALQTTLDVERRANEEKYQAMAKTKDELSATFSALSSQALKHNSGEFLKLANENLKQFQNKAHADLSEKEKSIENLLGPIKEALAKTETQIRHIEKERKEAYGSISKHLESMAQTQQMLHGETRNLVQALRRPEVRGQWGEMTLQRLAELAGMVEHCDFYSQEHVATEDARLRPDMVIRMPGRREIVVDVKTPLDAYLSAIEASDDSTRGGFLNKHAQNVRNRVRELAGKSYWSQFKQSPDFVVLFIPGDQFLAAALDVDRNLLEDALSQKVILATPTSLVALLRAVAYGWQQEVLTENAENIRTLGEDLYKRLAGFTGHLAKVGKQLNSTMENYNKAVGSFERSVMPGARKFTEMGITAKKPVDQVDQIETTARMLNVAPEDSPPDT
jgi:DNA recombination protein RmuC